MEISTFLRKCSKLYTIQNKQTFLTVLLQASFNCSTFDYKEHRVDTLITTCTDFYYSSYVLKKRRYLFVLNNMFIQCLPTFVTHAHTNKMQITSEHQTSRPTQPKFCTSLVTKMKNKCLQL